jgi:hypothetical protein
MPNDVRATAEAVAKAAEAAAKLIPVDKVYGDALQGTAKEIGKAGTDVARVARLLLAPVQLLAAYQVRFERFCERLANKVPEERRVEISSRVSGPVLEALRYIDEQDIVAEYMLNLLAAAMDSARSGDVHPGFSTIVAGLAPDEALILFHLKKVSFQRHFTRELFHGPPKKWGPAVFQLNESPSHLLSQPQHLEIYMSRLYFLGLAHVIDQQQEPIVEPPDSSTPNLQTGLRVKDKVELTEFGKLFVNACVPDELPAS